MTYAEFGSFEAYYNDPTKPDGLYRVGFREGDCYFLEGHFFVVGPQWVGTSTESLQLALEQFCHIRRVLDKRIDDKA